MNVVNHHYRYCLYYYYFIYYIKKIYGDVPDSDIDGDEDVLHADEVVDAPDAVV